MPTRVDFLRVDECRVVNRASHYIPWLYERNPEELRAWSPARVT